MTHRYIWLVPPPQPSEAVGDHKAAKEEDDKARQTKEDECEVFCCLHSITTHTDVVDD